MKVRWAYNVGISLAFLPISLSGLIYLVAGEGTRPLRMALVGVSVIGWIILTFVKRAVERESEHQTTEIGGPAADNITGPRSLSPPFVSPSGPLRDTCPWSRRAVDGGRMKLTEGSEGSQVYVGHEPRPCVFQCLKDGPAGDVAVVIGAGVPSTGGISC